MAIDPLTFIAGEDHMYFPGGKRARTSGWLESTRTSASLVREDKGGRSRQTWPDSGVIDVAAMGDPNEDAHDVEVIDLSVSPRRVKPASRQRLAAATTTSVAAGNSAADINGVFESDNVGCAARMDSVPSARNGYRGRRRRSAGVIPAREDEKELAGKSETLLRRGKRWMRREGPEEEESTETPFDWGELSLRLIAPRLGRGTEAGSTSAQSLVDDGGKPGPSAQVYGPFDGRPIIQPIESSPVEVARATGTDISGIFQRHGFQQRMRSQLREKTSDGIGRDAQFVCAAGSTLAHANESVHLTTAQTSRIRRLHRKRGAPPTGAGEPVSAESAGMESRTAGFGDGVHGIHADDMRIKALIDQGVGLSGIGCGGDANRNSTRECPSNTSPQPRRQSPSAYASRGRERGNLASMMLSDCLTAEIDEEERSARDARRQLGGRRDLFRSRLDEWRRDMNESQELSASGGAVPMTDRDRFIELSNAFSTAAQLLCSPRSPALGSTRAHAGMASSSGQGDGPSRLDGPSSSARPSRDHMLQHLPLQLRLALRDDDFTADDYEELLKLDDTVVNTGMGPAALKKLQVVKCSTAMAGEKCCVCLDAYERGQHLRRLPCGHTFHKKCIDKWLKMKPRCPICMINVKDMV